MANPVICGAQGLAKGADVNSEDSEVVRRGVALLADALAATAGIGGEYMCGVLFSALAKYPGPCSGACRKNVVESMQARFLQHVSVPRQCPFLIRMLAGRQLQHLVALRMACRARLMAPLRTVPAIVQS
jgi:hypothetical protein